MKRYRDGLAVLAGWFLLGSLVGGCVLPMHTTLPTPTVSLTETQLPWTPTPEVDIPSPAWTMTITSSPLSPTPASDPTPGQLAFTRATMVAPVPLVSGAYQDENRLFLTAHDNLYTGSGHPNSIYLHDLETGETELLYTSPYGDEGVVCCMRASPEWLTWLTYKSFGSGWLVVARHLPSGRELVLDREEDTGVKTLRGPFVALSGEQLVWVSIRAASDGAVKTYLILTNLATGVQQTLTEATMPDSLVYVDIDGERVVWSKGSSAGGVKHSDVYMYDLVSGTQTQLSDDHQSHQPQIEQEWIAWRQGFETTGPIVIYNWQTGERTSLEMEGDFLRMGDGLLLWWTYQNPFAYVYDLRNHAIDSFISHDHFRPPMYISGRTVASVTHTDPETLTNDIEIRTYLP